jgi:signal transduction histidine kinase/CheY-like chemotaxis protein
MNTNTQILIVEDEWLIAEITQKTLERLGYEVVSVAVSGEEAIRKAEECKPDLVLMDIVLEGDMDGIEAAGQIHSRFGIPIIFQTAYSDEKILERAKEIEPFGYLIKPVQERELYASIKMALYKHEVDEKLKENQEKLRLSLNEVIRRRAEVSALLESSHAVLKYRKFEDAARTIFDSCKKITGASAGYIALLTQAGSEIDVLFLDSGGRPCDVDPNLPMPIRGLRAEAYRSGKVVYDNNFPGSQWASFMPERHVALDNVLFAPLIVEGKTLGLMGLANKPGGFTENDARMAAAFAEHAAIALHNSRALMDLHTKHEELENAHKKLKKAQSFLIRQEKLASLGTLSAGVAHEIKNPLNIISTSVQLLQMEDNLSEETKEAYKTIIEQVNRAAKITENLRNFARERKQEIKEIELHAFLEKTLALVEYEMKVENLQIEKKLHKDPIYISGDEDQLAQVFLNMIGNARDSMNEKQKRHSYEELQKMGWAGRLTVETFISGSQVLVLFQDAGLGMAEEVKRKIFDPFFTTKGEGKGTGLGLSIAYGIIEAHGGTIKFESKEGKGTRFVISLPLKKESEKEDKEDKQTSNY